MIADRGWMAMRIVGLGREQTIECAAVQSHLMRHVNGAMALSVDPAAIQPTVGSLYAFGEDALLQQYSQAPCLFSQQRKRRAAAMSLPSLVNAL